MLWCDEDVQSFNNVDKCEMLLSYYLYANNAIINTQKKPKLASKLASPYMLFSTRFQPKPLNFFRVRPLTLSHCVSGSAYLGLLNLVQFLKTYNNFPLKRGDQNHVNFINNGFKKLRIWIYSHEIIAITHTKRHCTFNLRLQKCGLLSFV